MRPAGSVAEAPAALKLTTYIVVTDGEAISAHLSSAVSSNIEIEMLFRGSSARPEGKLARGFDVNALAGYLAPTTSAG